MNREGLKTWIEMFQPDLVPVSMYANISPLKRQIRTKRQQAKARALREILALYKDRSLDEKRLTRAWDRTVTRYQNALKKLEPLELRQELEIVKMQVDCGYLKPEALPEAQRRLKARVSA